MRRSRSIVVTLALMLGAPAALAAQDGLKPVLRDACIAGTPADELTRLLCQDVGTALQILQPEAGLLLSSGNPVLGTASPAGTRVRFVPRFNIGGRINVVFVDVPDVIDYPDATGDPVGTLDFPVPMAQLDLSVGVFDGFKMGPTLGGLGAVELIGSVSSLILPGGEGFQNDVTGFGLGARIGILRESFTAPGISLSALYKWNNRIEFGDISAGDDAQFGTDMQIWSLRAGLSKSFLAFGVAALVGWDHYSSDLDLAVREPTSGLVIPIASEDDPLELGADRWSAFLDVSYIMLFFNLVAEVGWQESESLPLTTGDEVESGNFFGALGVRLSL